MNNINKKPFFIRQITTTIALIMLITSLLPAVAASTTSGQLDTHKIMANQEIDSLKYSYLFKPPKLQEITFFNEEFTRLSIPGTLLVNTQPGEPAIPTSMAKFALPPSTQVKKSQ